jgi:hypothetical protein
MPIITPSRHFEGSEFTSEFTTYLDTIPWESGCRDNSGHLAFLRAASLGIHPDVAIKEVTTRIVATGGSFNPSKIKDQLRRAYTYAGREADETKALVKPPRATFSPEQLKVIATKVPPIDAQWLATRSPIPVDATSSSHFLDQLYQPGEKIVVFDVFESQGQVLYEIGAPWQPPLPADAPQGVWFLVNPVDGESHPNPRQDDKLSRRSEEAITNWRYLVLESDIADPNEWLACLVQLPMRIAAIYTSGGKSIHALVRLDADSKKDWDSLCAKIKPIVVTLGADEGALTAVRLSRLPGALRAGRPQQLLYLDPNPTGTPIFQKEAGR